MNPRRRRINRRSRKRRKLHIEIDDLVAKLDHLQPHYIDLEAAEDLDANELVVVRPDGKAVRA